MWEYVGTFPTKLDCSICESKKLTCIVPSKFPEDWLFENMCLDCLDTYLLCDIFFEFVRNREIGLLVGKKRVNKFRKSS